MDGDVSDADLVVAARGGDMGAFAILLARYRPSLLARCRRTLRDPALAEDATQEASLQALLHLDGLRHAERFGPWLVGIGLNVCRMWLRSHERDHFAPPTRPNPDEPLLALDVAYAQAEAADVAVRIRQALDALPSGQRAAVLLFYLSDLTYIETADALGIELGAVRTRLHKARGTLRRHLWAVYKEQILPISGRHKQYTCLFCGQSQRTVLRMIACPNGAICDVCVVQCTAPLVDADRFTARFRCSLCGKGNGEARRTVTRPSTASMCLECASRCTAILTREGAKTATR